MSRRCFADEASDANEEAAIRDHELLEASSVGDLERIRAAVASGANVEARQRPDAWLHAEAAVVAQEPTESEEDFQEVLVLDDGFFHHGGLGVPERLNPNDAKGLTPLMRAAKAGMPLAVELLLNIRATPHAQDSTGLTPLHFAAQAGCHHCCAALLKAGANRFVLDDGFLDAYAYVPPYLLQAQEHQKVWAALLRPEELFRARVAGYTGRKTVSASARQWQQTPQQQQQHYVRPGVALVGYTPQGLRQHFHGVGDSVPADLQLTPTKMAPSGAKNRLLPALAGRPVLATTSPMRGPTMIVPSGPPSRENSAVMAAAPAPASSAGVAVANSCEARAGTTTTIEAS